MQLASLQELLSQPVEHSPTATAAVREELKSVLGHLVVVGTRIPSPLLALIRTTLAEDSMSQSTPIKLAVYLTSGADAPLIQCTVTCTVRVARVAGTLAERLGVPVESVTLRSRTGDVLNHRATIHDVGLAVGDVVTWAVDGTPSAPASLDAINLDDDGERCCDSSHTLLAVGGINVAGRSRPVKVNVNPVMGRVQFGWEPPLGFECPLCASKAAPHTASTYMHRGELVRHLQRYHTQEAVQLSCPLCSVAAGRATPPVRLMEHVQEHSGSHWYGGTQSFGHAPSEAAEGAAVAPPVTIPVLSFGACRNIVETLALDTCTEYVHSVVVTMLATFSLVPLNAANFRSMLTVATAQLCEESIRSLEAMEDALREQRDWRAVVPVEPPTSDRLLLGAVQVRVSCALHDGVWVQPVAPPPTRR